MKALGLGCNLIKCRIRRLPTFRALDSKGIHCHCPLAYVHGHVLLTSTDKRSRMCTEKKKCGLVSNVRNVCATLQCMFGVLTFRHPMIADMSLLRHILRAFVCHFISECSGGHNSSTVKLQNLQRNYSGLKRNKIFAFLPSAHVQVPESYFSMTPSWTSPCGHVA